ncbi:sacsin N-terminal ATP-binding-like domain-containing protein [Deinococcus sp. AJ005]|uniref:sacsin N-terminal ATP-binding-like domain-containing protein n=1 Tax=Deinococcus sp. AJ005 TaxID=2652443 RepID=UPI00125CB01E|nr:ATP-binding protein [Deinococcus sp. AJ005]QFP75446.1 hypothetical protein DAAJ005_02425 [Deinococcus sp. AJ005]
MSVLQDIKRRRRNLAQTLKEHQGIRTLVEQLYPDRAHFIYELLQNAEDAGATQATFRLLHTSLVFEHDGRAFEPADIEAITDIGSSSKQDDQQTIGRFGIGFKAVFAYTNTPRIYSPTYSFRIDDLVLPSPLTANSKLGPVTRFEFPFDNPKKPAAVAFQEIQQGLEALQVSTLLFLNTLASICWEIEGGAEGAVHRVVHADHHLELITNPDSDDAWSDHYVMFSAPVPGLPRHRAAIAFELDYLPGVEEYDHRKPLAKQMKVVDANPGQVFVFFPAEKETSGLRFHLHAPFVPEVSRASIKDTTANAPLFNQLADVTAAALQRLKKLKLLTPELLSVLPNNDDPLPLRYRPIRAAVLLAMRQKDLTPTFTGGHAPAEVLLQARVQVKELIEPRDLHVLLQTIDPLEWAANVNQKNGRIDKFYSSLGVEEWDVEALVDTLKEHLSEATAAPGQTYTYLKQPTPEVLTWLQGKSVDWMRELYATLERHYLGGWQRAQKVEGLATLKIVRLADGMLTRPSEAYFANAQLGSAGVPTVDTATFTRGKKNDLHPEARQFLVAIGVRELDAVSQMDRYLRQNYGEFSRNQKFEDMELFLRFAEEHPHELDIFRGATIFKVKSKGGPGVWASAETILFSQPYAPTGLDQFYRQELQDAKWHCLTDDYQTLDKRLPAFLKFCERVGVKSSLEISRVGCYGNTQYAFLVVKAPGNWSDNKGINIDFTIPGLQEALQRPSLDTSRLIWTSLLTAKDPNFTEAMYRSNSAHDIRRAPSKLIEQLKKAKWVPQGDRFVQPAQALVSKLPKGFYFDPAAAWIKAIDFGSETRRQEEMGKDRQQSAKLLGFPDDEKTLEMLRELAKLPKEELGNLAAKARASKAGEFPERTSSNPERRTKHVGAAAAQAPQRQSETRERSVSVNYSEVKTEARQYLSDQYTLDGDLYCQICQKPMPFRLDNGQPYFEAVELVPDLTTMHPPNYLALCPNHAAMFERANKSKSALRFLIKQAHGVNIDVMLAGQERKVRFTKMHLEDLRIVLDQLSKSSAQSA